MEYAAEACGCGALQVERDYGWTMFEARMVGIYRSMMAPVAVEPSTTPR